MPIDKRVNSAAEALNDVADGATCTVLPFTFICTELLPSVSNILGAVCGGIVCPELKICPAISFFPVPSTRHTYTVPVGMSSSLAVVGRGSGQPQASGLPRLCREWN